MKKTALQQLIEQLEEQKKAVPSFTYGKGLDYAIQAAKLKLETEREQIEDAFIQGTIVGDSSKGKSSEEYFNDTYQ